MVGIGCLILELKMPGVGLPGVIAALCFVLFFWAHSQLNGQITLLAVLLFLLGLVLIGIEVFLVPGMGVLGISGVVLLLVGLGLATVEHMPDRKSTRLNSSHVEISYAVFCLKKKKKKHNMHHESKMNIKLL